MTPQHSGGGLDIAAVVDDLRSTFGGPDACAADLLCGRHPRTDVAFTVVEPDLGVRDLTYGELDDASGRLAGALAARGVGRGDRVATLMARSAELMITSLAVWRLGAVQVPLFTAFAPGAVAERIVRDATRWVVVDARQRPKLDPGPDLPADPLRAVVTTGPARGADLSWHALLAEGAPAPEPVAVGGTGTLLELFTSGTTGSPKPVPVPLGAVAAMSLYQEFYLGHSPEDVFWNPSDPAWANGLYYAVLGPLALGRRSLLLHADFSPELMWSVLSRMRVTNLFAAPTVYRALRKADADRPDDLVLRHCSSASEPLAEDVIAWAERVLGVPIRDQYGQTEMGVITGNPWHPALITPLRPGSMGRAVPGFAVDVLRVDADEPAAAGEYGRVAIDLHRSPLMTFTGYRDAPERSAGRFSADRRWYLTGDLAACDADGFFRFSARDDDIIAMAGYRIGPAEIERVVDGHPAVAEVAVVGEPDELRGEVVVAYVVPRPGLTVGAAALVAELKRLVKTRLAAHLYPRRVYVVDRLPKTASGKVQRARLRRATTEHAA